MSSALQLVGWNQQLPALHDSLERFVATTAKCRTVIPRAPDQLGAGILEFPRMAKDEELSLAAPMVITPVRLFVSVALNYRLVKTEADVVALMEAAAARLGRIEDESIIHGVEAIAGGGPSGRERSIGRDVLAVGSIVKDVDIKDDVHVHVLAGQEAGKSSSPSPDQVLKAIREAAGAIEGARPGPLALLVDEWLDQSIHAEGPNGASSIEEEVERRLGTNLIVATRALNNGNPAEGGLCGVFFRTEPPAIDLVRTQQPTVVVMERKDGNTTLRIEEQIAVRVRDPNDVRRLVYKKAQEKAAKKLADQ